MEKYHKLRKYANGILLLAFIGAMVLLNIITRDKAFSEEENRVLEQIPKFSFNQLFQGKFTSNFEKYIADQFAFRDFWVGIKSESELALGMKENNNVYVGKDGYLFEDFNKPSEMNFKERMETINSFAELAPKLNTYFMLVPNSVKVLEDKLPEFAPVDDELVYLNKVKGAVDKNIKFVDVYDTLYSKRNEYIYYRTDHHWTTKAAFYAYEELARDMGFTPYGEDYFNVTKVADDFYGTLYSRGGFRNVKPDSIELYLPKNDDGCLVVYDDNGGVSNSLYDMNNLEKKDKYTVFLGGNHPLVKISSKCLSGRKLLVFKDSYTNCLIPFLNEHFSEIYMVDPRYYDGDLAGIINENKIKDVLILYNVNTFFEDTSINNLYDNIKELSFEVDFDTGPSTPEEKALASDDSEKSEENSAATAENNKEVSDKPSGNYNKIFKDTVFMGDSITEGLSVYGFLDDSRVKTKVGASVVYAKGQVNNVAKLKPKRIFLLYGINEIGNRSSQNFAERYRGLIQDIKEKLPDTEIYIQSIFPISPVAEKKRKDLNNAHIRECNEGLIKLAAEENVHYADVASLLNEDNRNLYAGDGIHFKTKFYIMWLNYLEGIIKAESVN